MQVQVNGEPRELGDESTVGDLLTALGLARDGVAVAVNRKVVPATRHRAHRLQPGDQVEVIQAVGGG